MRVLWRLIAIGLAPLPSSITFAGSIPLYEPAPAWVLTAKLPQASDTAPLPALVLIDQQQRIQDGKIWNYVDRAVRVDSAEILAQLATLTVPWMPDKGDMIVHEVSILRGTERIDLIAKGQKFETLRREQSLEQLELTGVLTATLAIEGLRVGDILRFRATTTMRDATLRGHAQMVMPLPASPFRAGFARLRVTWPNAAAPNIKLHAKDLKPEPIRDGSFSGLSITLPAPQQPEIPEDAPSRYKRPPLLEITTFKSWSDVAKVMAPLYQTENTIKPGSAIAAEIATIVKENSTPMARAAGALQLVQDKVRYLAVQMDGGNYVPQSPDKTWEVRYGDCKAKTLLLLAMLRAMDIEAEPVLANAFLGDFVPERQPSATAFNHVLVHAKIDGQDLWLDGTGSGSRLADIRDTPDFGYVLPVRMTDVQPIPIVTRANARPMIDATLSFDESASTDLPTVFDASLVIRGPSVAMFAAVKSQMGEKEQRGAVSEFLKSFVGEAQLARSTIETDPAAGTVTIKAHGVTSTPWFNDERKRKRNLSRAFDTVGFAPDRARAAWQAIPVQTPAPFGLRYHVRVRLPDGGKGYSLEGDPNFTGKLANFEIARTARLEDGLLALDERIDALGGEIATSQVASERDRVATAAARAPRLVAPSGTLRRWSLGGREPAGATQLKAVEAVFAQAIATDPDEVSGYTSRASFRSGIGDWRGAIADLTRAIELEPSTALYLQRAANSYESGDLTSSLVDAEKARGLEPSSAEAIGRVGWLKAERGNLAEAAALLDERIALGGDARTEYRQAKANLLGEFGDPGEAIKLYDALIADKPGSPTLMNGRCWVKGTRAVMLDTALKDCTSAIELSSETFASLDSRAVVWYRLGRYEDALRDLDAALAAMPNLAPSRFLRGVVLNRLGRKAEGADELAIARALSPSVDRTYRRYGILP